MNTNQTDDNQIPIIYGAPIIATKDREWLRNHPRLEPGAIWILPNDAVLIMPPELVEVTPQTTDTQDSVQ